MKLDGDGSRLVELGWNFEKNAGIGDGMELLRGWVGWNGSDVGRVRVTAEMIPVSLGAISVSTLVSRIYDTVHSPCYEREN